METLSSLFANFFLLFTVFAFVAVFLLLEGLYLVWSSKSSPEARKLERRLHALVAGAPAEQEAALVKQRLLRDATPLQRLLFRLPRMRHFDRMLEQSGVRITLTRLVTIAVLLGLTAFGAGALLYLPPPVPLALGVGTTTLPFIYVLRRRMRRINTIDRQLPDALDLIGRALRAGHAFPSGLQMVGEEMAEPIAGEFRITHEEINYGISLKQALMNLAARVPSTDLRYFVIAVLIQRETGGNLTELLDNLSRLMRERFKLFEKIRVLSAEGKLSAWIVGVLPFFLAGVIHLINPGFMKVLWTDPMGLKMLWTMAVLMLLGIVWMRKIIKIHV